jgi:hypothetical protein
MKDIDIITRRLTKKETAVDLEWKHYIALCRRTRGEFLSPEEMHWMAENGFDHFRR